MNLQQTITIYCGGPGSGRHPEEYLARFAGRNNEVHDKLIQMGYKKNKEEDKPSGKVTSYSHADGATAKFSEKYGAGKIKLDSPEDHHSEFSKLTDKNGGSLIQKKKPSGTSNIDRFYKSVRESKR